MRYLAQRHSFGVIAPQQTVDVFVQTTLPGVVGLGKIDITIHLFGHALICCKLDAIIESDRFTELAIRGEQQDTASTPLVLLGTFTVSSSLDTHSVKQLMVLSGYSSAMHPATCSGLKPIFSSLFSCSWCHVLNRFAFEALRRWSLASLSAPVAL